MIIDHLRNGRLKIIAKPGSDRTKVLGYDEERAALRVSIKAPADKNKANLELLKFLSRETGMKARIRSGQASKEKIIEFL